MSKNANFWLFYEIYIWKHWKKFQINFFDIWNFFYNELFQNFLIFKHFLYMLVPKMIHYSKTVDVQPLNFWYFFCFVLMQKMAPCKSKSDISVMVLILWPKMSTKFVWKHCMTKTSLANEIIYTDGHPEICRTSKFCHTRPI